MVLMCIKGWNWIIDIESQADDENYECIDPKLEVIGKNRIHTEQSLEKTQK